MKILQLLVVLQLAWTLTACSPRFIPAGEAIAAPRLEGRSFITFDGTKLPLSIWLPAKNSLQAVMITVHGFNDYSNFIRSSTDFFNANGIAVYAYDQRGFGSAPFRGRWSGTRVLARDLATFIHLVRKKHPHTPVYLLGDSMGGAVVIVTMTGENPPAVDGVILAAPAVWSRSEMPFYQRWLLEIAARVMPWGVGSGQGLDITPSDNEEMLRELGRDPLIIKESRFDTLYGLTNLMDAAYGRAGEYTVKTLVLYGRKDEVIPGRPVMEVFNHFRGDRRLLLYKNGYHMLLRDLQAQVVREDIAAWLRNPTRLLPSIRNGAAIEIINAGSAGQ